MQTQPQGKGRGKKGGQQAANQQAAATNRATPSRPFSVQKKTTPPPKNTAVQKVPPTPQHQKWAGGAFLNSPAPSALPMPSIALPNGGATASGGGSDRTAFQDPAIVGTTKPPPASWAEAARPPPQLAQDADLQAAIAASLAPPLPHETSQQHPMPPPAAPRAPSVPPVLLPAGARVHAQFLDGEWYDGTIVSNTPAGASHGHQ